MPAVRAGVEGSALSQCLRIRTPRISQDRCAGGVIEASKNGGEAVSTLQDKWVRFFDGTHGQSNITIALTSRDEYFCFPVIDGCDSDSQQNTWMRREDSELSVYYAMVIQPVWSLSCINDWYRLCFDFFR